jgi:hypothetical protein
MHLTVLNLDPYVAAGEGGEAAVIERAADVLGGHGPFRLTLRGLNVSPWTVFAQAYGAAAEADEKRTEEIARAWARATPAGEARPLAGERRSWGPFIPTYPALRRGGTTFGPFEVHEVEVVRTDGFMSLDRTKIIATAALRS